ncbi:MAG: sulfurtransferase [Proteobacteria bacterium]|nr:MAG: sulfurtransferase [Pseudomonadota bacterium]
MARARREPRPVSLVSAAWLAAHAADSDVRIVDFRWYLGGKRGADEYLAGHVPGAVFVDLSEVTAPEGPGRHPLPAPSQLQEAMQRAGVNIGDHVVVVDDAGGSIAARLWWLLREHGHARVSVLDGGLPAWSRAGHPLDTHIPTPPRGTFEAGAPHGRAVDKHAVATRDSATLLLDVRAAERYRGDLEPIDARPGHIPGAVNAPWSGNLGPEGTFASPDTLRARYRALGVTPDRPVIVSCGSGVTACHALLAFDVAGLPAPRLYEGSYSDWAADPSLSVDTGDVSSPTSCV